MSWFKISLTEFQNASVNTFTKQTWSIYCRYLSTLWKNKQVKKLGLLEATPTQVLWGVDQELQERWRTVSRYVVLLTSARLPKPGLFRGRAGKGLGHLVSVPKILHPPPTRPGQDLIGPRQDVSHPSPDRTFQDMILYMTWTSNTLPPSIHPSEQNQTYWWKHYLPSYYCTWLVIIKFAAWKGFKLFLNVKTKLCWIWFLYTSIFL